LRRDLACAALGLALAAAYWMAAHALPTSSLADAVGAEGVPKSLAAVLALFSLLVGLRALRRRDESRERKSHGRALLIAAIGFAYLLVVPFAGYLVSIALLAAVAALHYGAPRRPGVALFGVGTALVLWLVFGALLDIALP
jgi:hypothetical protein